VLHDPLGVVADQRRRRLLDEARQQRLVDSIRRDRRRPRRAVVSQAWLRLRHSVSTARTAVREIAAMPGTDATLPRLRDYPIAQHPAPQPCNADG